MGYRQLQQATIDTIRRMLGEGASQKAIMETAGVSSTAVITQRKKLEREKAGAVGATESEKPPTDRESLLAKYREITAKLDYVTDEAEEQALQRKRDEVARALGRVNQERLAVVALRSNTVDPHILPPRGAEPEDDEDDDSVLQPPRKLQKKVVATPERENMPREKKQKDPCSRCGEKPAIARGMCTVCWSRAKRAGEFTPGPPGTRTRGEPTRKRANKAAPPQAVEPAEGGQRGYRVHINGCVVECGCVADVVALTDLVGAKA